MSNFSPDDIHRSLRRYLAAPLEGWTVRTQREEVKDSDRPVAVVESASPVTTTRARVTIPQGDVDKMQSFSAMAYPAILDTAREGRFEAGTVAQLLDDTITLGLVSDDDPPVNIGAPLRVPIYDYAGVPLTGAGRAGPADPYGYAWVEDHSVNVIQDPIDPLRWTIALDLRLSWTQAGRGTPDAPIAASMPGAFVP